MDLPSLAKLIIEFLKEMKGRFKNKDEYIKDLQIQNLRFKDQLEEIEKEKEVLCTQVEQATESEGCWIKQV